MTRKRYESGITDITEYIKNGHPTQTFSSNNPPYCYTPICPDPEKREKAITIRRLPPEKRKTTWI